MIRALTFITFFAAATSAAAQTQFPAEVAPGARVRVWLPEPTRQPNAPEHRQLVNGTVESVGGSTLRLAVAGTTGSLAIQRASLRRLDVSHGVSRGASMVERAIGGAIGGAITLALMNDPNRSSGPHYRRDWRAAGVGATWGAGIGAVIGLAFPYERWVRVIH